MYVLSDQGKTMVGNNEDSWGQDSRIWFEQGTPEKFGVAYVGYARKHPHPDGAVNEFGLVFDAFTMLHRSEIPEKEVNKKDFAYAHVRTIMQQYKTVDEVYAYLSQLNLHVLNGSPIFNGGMLLFVDKTGKYLAVEAHKMTFGKDAKFVLANFSMADTEDLSAIKTARYRKGVAFLSNKKLDTQLSFCTALSDTMSVNREKIGDGTLYTSIYDLDEGLIHLYFYHDFTKRKTFHIKEELAKGDHVYTFSELFPNNQKLQNFLAYKTPQNSTFILVFLIVCGLFFFFSAAFYLMSFFKSPNANFNYLKIGLSVFSISLGVYAFVLLRNQGIFYFPAPYDDGHSLIVALTSFLPFILLLVIIPLWAITVKIFRQKRWGKFVSYLVAINNFAYLLFLGLFVYWKLFDIWS